MFPLLVNGVPRSGTTILMHSLASHPQIVAHEDYPYETRYAIWVWQNFKVLSQPQKEKGHQWMFQDNENYAEKNPFYSIKKDLRGYFNNDYIKLMSNAAKRQVDHYYSYLARRYNKDNPQYFLEKFPGISEDLLRSQYPKYRSIYILRNPIDVYLSVQRINLKRGRLDFEADKFDHPQDHIKELIKRTLKFMNKYTKDDDVYVIKYEDFISFTKDTIQSIFTFLELEVNDNILSLGEQRARDRSFVEKHSTSVLNNKVDIQKESISFLNDEILEAVSKDCGKELQLLGYELGRKMVLNN